MRDLYNVLNPVVALAPTAAVKATVASATIDTAGFDGVLLEASIGIPGDTLSGSVWFEFDVQDSPDGTVWTAVADQYVQNAVGTANGAGATGSFGFLKSSPAAASILKGGYLGNQRYVRVNTVFTGTHTNGTNIGINAILGHARHTPAGVTPQVP